MKWGVAGDSEDNSEDKHVNSALPPMDHQGSSIAQKESIDVIYTRTPTFVFPLFD